MNCPIEKDDTAKRTELAHVMTLVPVILGATAINLLPAQWAIPIWFGIAILAGAMRRPWFPDLPWLRSFWREVCAVSSIIFRGQ